ncbi:MAG: zinc ribbon domain-containing protein [Halioglobus sp.]|nr:zinc ribbon domain-containing protein [Halioglobus sp.]
MPIYEYQCQACQHQMEALQKISDPALQDCPQCGAPCLKKKVSAAAFRLKGSGWYETDFKTGNKKNLVGGSDGGDSSASDKPTSSGSESPKPSESKSADSKKTA